MQETPVTSLAVCGGAILCLGLIVLVIVGGVVFFLARRKKQPLPAARPASPARPAPPPGKPDFPLGDNIVTDADIKTIDDLEHYYPLPPGFEYRVTAAGVPQVVRSRDGHVYNRFVIEADMMTFDEPYTRSDGRIGYQTTEVIKITAR